jgi:DNA polymerase-1
MLISHGITFATSIDDVQAMAHLLNAVMPLKLNNLAATYLGTDISPADILKSWLKWMGRTFLYRYGRKPNYSDVPWNIMNPYVSMHSRITLQLYFLMKGPVREQFKDLYDMEIASIPAIIEMGLRGVPIDKGYCRRQMKGLRIKNRRIARKWAPINLLSPKQIGEQIFPRLKIKVKEFTKKGAPSTKKEVIEDLSVDYPELKDIVAFRSNNKLANTYFDNLIEASILGIIYPKFNPYGAKTGRFSSSDPNLQNQPRGPIVRSAFTCRPGYALFYYDLKQVELRRMAEYADDEPFIRIFLNGEDPHYDTAIRFYGKKRGPKERFKGKVANLSIIYGIRGRRLAREADIPVEEAERHIRVFFEEHPAIKLFREKVIYEARQTGRVMDYWGRMYSVRKEEDVRAIPNWLIQGDCATLLKRALIRVSGFLRENPSTNAHHLMVIHDEIPVEIPLDASLIGHLAPVIKDEMEEPRKFKIPTPVEIEWSLTNWGEKMKWDPATFRDVLRRFQRGQKAG